MISLSHDPYLNHTCNILSVLWGRMSQAFFTLVVSGKESTCNAGDTGVTCLIPESGRSPGEGNSNPLQYSCLENPLDRGAWRAAVHRVSQSQAARLKRLSTAPMQALRGCLWRGGTWFSLPHRGQWLCPVTHRLKYTTQQQSHFTFHWSIKSHGHTSLLWGRKYNLSCINIENEGIGIIF